MANSKWKNTSREKLPVSFHLREGEEEIDNLAKVNRESVYKYRNETRQ